MHLREEISDGVIISAIMKQQEPCIAWGDIRRHEQVVEPIYSLRHKWQQQKEHGSC